MEKPLHAWNKERDGFEIESPGRLIAHSHKKLAEATPEQHTEHYKAHIRVGRWSHRVSEGDRDGIDYGNHHFRFAAKHAAFAAAKAKTPEEKAKWLKLHSKALKETEE